MTQNTDISNFITSPQVLTSNLSLDAVIQVCWAPDRRCHFRHLGNGTYEVVLSENSKLAIGDTFRCPFFVLGEPLFLDQLMHQGNGPLIYELGKKGGLTEVLLLEGSLLTPSIDTLEDMERHIRLFFPKQIPQPSDKGAQIGVHSLTQTLFNAVQSGHLVFSQDRLTFPVHIHEKECGFVVHKLKEYYDFLDWSELELLVTKVKADGTPVKALRQIRTFHPRDDRQLEARLLSTLFLPQE